MIAADENQAITIKEVAEKAGVHQSTVSRAFSGGKGVSCNVRDKIFAIAKELNYQPNRLAQSISRRKTDTIGFICMGRGRHYEQAGRYLQSFLAKSGYTLDFVFVEPMDAESEKRAMDQFVGQRVDGLIMHISGFGITPDDVRSLQKRNIPVVMFEPPTEEYSKVCDTVTVDWTKGAKEITEHLITLGCKRLAYNSGDIRFVPDKQRLDGLCLGLAQHGMNLSKQVKIDLKIDHSNPDKTCHTYGYEGAISLIESGNKVDAFICHNDEYAMGALAAFYDKGIKVPQDILVTGFDNIPESLYTYVPLTTVSQPISEISKMLSSLVVARVENNLETKPINYFVQPELVIRNSSQKNINTERF